MSTSDQNGYLNPNGESTRQGLYDYGRDVARSGGSLPDLSNSTLVEQQAIKDSYNAEKKQSNPSW